MNEDISKLFALEVREKKKVGSNIFKRVSTRRGGTNMSSMRVPTIKEQKELSGKVSAFNMKKIIPYYEFQEKSEKDQKMLLDYWRNQYKTSTIIQELGIDKNRYYRLLDNLGIERKKTSKNIVYERTAMSSKELNSYLKDKNNLLDYELFRIITSEQQDILLEEYLNRYLSIPKLVSVWEGAQAGSLYYMKNRIAKKTANETNHAPQEEKKRTVATPFKQAIAGETQEKEPLERATTESVKEPVMNVEAETDETKEKDILPMKEAVAETTLEPSARPVEEQMPVLASKPTNTHDVSIQMDKGELGQSFQFSLKGTYSKESIIRRLSMLMEEIQESEEMLTIDISIKG